jgi:Transglutaminase-like superfamily
VSSLRREAALARSLPPAQRCLLVEATGWLGLLRIATLTLPYRRVASLLRLSPSPAPDGPASGWLPDCADHRAGAVGWAVRAAAARTPWLSTCLVQSLAGYAILRWRRVPSVVYLGVAKDTAGRLTAHSWLRCGDRIVTGGGDHQRYSVIACYQRAPGRRR